MPELNDTASDDAGRWKLSPKRRAKMVIFRLIRLFVLTTIGPIVGLRVHGLHNMPAKGPALIIANHLHNADPFIIGAVFPRPILFMAKQELFSIPFLGWFIRQAGSFPVDRENADRRAVRHAQRLLSEGMLVGIFTEGTRSTTGGLKDIYPGVALIASHTGVPVVPVAVHGTESLPFNGAKGRKKREGRWRVTVRIGRPFYLPERRPGEPRLRLEEQADLMMLEVARLLPEEYRGIYAERLAPPARPASAPAPELSPLP